MQSFLGKQEVKEKYLNRVKMHAASDELIHGTYWQDGKGCAVGCTVETSNNSHNRFEIELGIPEWLAHLEDSLFESMSSGEAQSWPQRFLEAIPIGKDLNYVRPKFLKWLLTDPESGVIRFVDGKYDKKDEYTSKARAAILHVEKVMDNWIQNGKPNIRAAESARSAATSRQAEKLLELLREA